MSLKCCLILCSLLAAVYVVSAQSAGTPEQVQPVNLSANRFTTGFRDLQAHL